MRYSFRLAELLGHVPDPRKRPGTIKAIVDYTGLDRHQVAALLKNEVKYIPLKALSRICDYLIEHGHASADQLPGALFAVEPENFWELLARRRRLEMCLGIRRDPDDPTSPDEVPEVSYVVASDSVLLGEILNGVTTLGGTASFRGGESQAILPHPEHLKQSLVWSPGQASPEEVSERADTVYREFNDFCGDKALVSIGSTKSNPVVEMTISQVFGCEPFTSQDDVKDSRDRACPFFLRYRDNDPHPASCMSGLRLSQTEETKTPGIYYETPEGKWVLCSPPEKREDTGFVFYAHRESQGHLEMAIGGFSGRATRLLARALATRAESFWPPVYNDQGIQVGCFLVQFSPSAEKNVGDLLRTDLVAETKIIRLSSEVIERRMQRAL
ncbi:MAG: helix-turn-helix transcriptional regulator [Planctomycetota bacterium]|nr:helix-turn-helix transcriptional regulator [Planctomycetota bacterium]MEC8569727.1 helix-turn-helix transcriptional regulator [Planctomycetota bacterium]